MEENSAFDLLLDLVKAKTDEFETHQDSKRFYLFPLDPLLKTKYIVFQTGDLLFCAYDSFATRAYMNSTFTGLYREFNDDSDLEMKLYNRDWIDRILKMNRYKTGDDFLDSKFTIESNREVDIEKIFNHEKAKQFLDLSQEIQPLEMMIQDDYLPMIQRFKMKKIIGIETNRWLYTPKDFETFLEKGSKILK